MSALVFHSIGFLIVSETTGSKFSIRSLSNCSYSYFTHRQCDDTDFLSASTISSFTEYKITTSRSLIHSSNPMVFHYSKKTKRTPQPTTRFSFISLAHISVHSSMCYIGDQLLNHSIATHSNRDTTNANGSSYSHFGLFSDDSFDLFLFVSFFPTMMMVIVLFISFIHYCRMICVSFLYKYTRVHFDDSSPFST